MIEAARTICSVRSAALARGFKLGVLEGKVVLVTGAGGGIGRCHALACAAEGAFIVVNDLGGSRDGTGAGSSMADDVVAEIEALGGQAIANYDSVTDEAGCERMVDAAIAEWGRLDGVVNNAGILRDRTFAKMSRAEWDLVIDVHLNGTRNVTRAALDALKASGGAIVNTTSFSGMIGNFGQSNYAAAKAGIYGLTRVLALELRRAGVRVNALAPVAKTRMTDDIQMVQDDWRPEQISPIVVHLLSDTNQQTGRVFGVQGQRIHVYEVKMNDGVEKEGDALWTPGELAAQMEAITTFPVAAAVDAQDDEQDVVTHAFSFFPTGYLPEGAPGWNAVIHWSISGGSDQTLSIHDGVCSVAVGLAGQPTCTVTTDRGTVIALLGREIEPANAFMTGKAKADNMGDLMKMAMAFDFEAIAEAVAAEQPAADPVSEVFSFLPAGFSADGAPGWRAVIHWAVDGAPDQTLTVDPDGARVKEGLHGEATCTVTVAQAVLLDMFQGRLEPAQAFMQGKAKADNMGDLMKMAMAFDFKAVAAAYEAAHPSEESGPDSGDDEAFEPPIGKRYNGGYWQALGSEFAAYAKATNDENPAYFGEDAIAPPMYHVRPLFELMMKMATDPDLRLDIRRLVHAEHDIRFLSPIRHGQVIDVRGELVSFSEKSSGKLVGFDVYGFVDGERAFEGRTSYFIRGKKKPDGGKKKSKAPAEEPPAPSWTQEQFVEPDQAARYAVASGDDNPIHVDSGIAKAAGLPDVILHGLCTMAFAQRDIVNHAAGGDPTRLRRLGLRWTKPVLLDQTLTLQVWDGEGGSMSFVTRDAQGSPVVVNGVAEVG